MAKKLKPIDGMPDFLRIPQEKRNEVWAKNPPTFFAPVLLEKDREAEYRELRETFRREEANKLLTRIEKKKEVLDTTGLRWDTNLARWIPDAPMLTPSKKLETKEIASMTTLEKYNELVLVAVELGIKAVAVKKFRTAADGEKRLAKLREEIAAAKTASKTRAGQATGIVAEFGQRVGSNREKLLLALEASKGKQVANEDLSKAVYGVKGKVGAMMNVMKGLILACPKQYEIVKDEGSHGLSLIKA